MEDIDWVDNLALRGSYGTSGNDKLVPRNTSSGTAGDEIFICLSTYYTSADFYGAAGYKPRTIATPNLKWERNEQYNIALDFSVLSRFERND